MFEYEKWIEESFLLVLQKALLALKNTPNGKNHLYIEFYTRHPGVQIHKLLLSQYPEKMLIVLENQYSDLEVNNEGFSVTLSFGEVPYNLYIPFSAISLFNDPFSKIGCQFPSNKLPKEESTTVKKNNVIQFQRK